MISTNCGNRRCMNVSSNRQDLETMTSQAGEQMPTDKEAVESLRNMIIRFSADAKDDKSGKTLVKGFIGQTFFPRLLKDKPDDEAVYLEDLYEQLNEEEKDDLRKMIMHAKADMPFIVTMINVADGKEKEKE